MTCPKNLSFKAKRTGQFIHNYELRFHKIDQIWIANDIYFNKGNYVHK